MAYERPARPGSDWKEKIGLLFGFLILVMIISYICSSSEKNEDPCARLGFSTCPTGVECPGDCCTATGSCGCPESTQPCPVDVRDCRCCNDDNSCADSSGGVTPPIGGDPAPGAICSTEINYDLNRDGLVNLQDVGEWDNYAALKEQLDINSDGVVSSADSSILSLSLRAESYSGKADLNHDLHITLADAALWNDLYRAYQTQTLALDFDGDGAVTSGDKACLDAMVSSGSNPVTPPPTTCAEGQIVCSQCISGCCDADGSCSGEQQGN
ncbi:MAG: hypothetical protein ABIH99_03530 [Candidatus Micrarchaeota archaeon]